MPRSPKVGRKPWRRHFGTPKVGAEPLWNQFGTPKVCAEPLRNLFGTPKVCATICGNISKICLTFWGTPENQTFLRNLCGTFAEPFRNLLDQKGSEKVAKRLRAKTWHAKRFPTWLSKICSHGSKKKKTWLSKITSHGSKKRKGYANHCGNICATPNLGAHICGNLSSICRAIYTERAMYTESYI